MKIMVSWDENVVISSDMPAFILNMNNQIIFSNSMLNQLKNVSIQEGILIACTEDGQVKTH